jgi:hypothetical protein
LNFATFPSKLPWPMRTTNTTSSSAVFPSASNALVISSFVDFPVIPFSPAFSDRNVTRSLGTPIRPAASTSVVAHR